MLRKINLIAAGAVAALGLSGGMSGSAAASESYTIKFGNVTIFPFSRSR